MAAMKGNTNVHLNTLTSSDGQIISKLLTIPPTLRQPAIQDGGSSQLQLEPSLPRASHGQVNQVALAVPHLDPTLPPLLKKLRSKIAKDEYIDFNEFLSDNMYPHLSFAST